MAKKKSDKKKINLDKEYSNIIRNQLKQVLLKGASRIHEEYGIDLYQDFANEIKELFIYSEGEFSFSLVNIEDIVKFIDFSTDLVLSGNKTEMVLDKAYKYFSNKFKEENYNWEPFLAINRLTRKYELVNQDSELLKNNIINVAPEYLLMFTLYIIIKNKKVKNSKIKGIINKDNSVDLEYEILPLYDINTIKNDIRLVIDFTQNLFDKCNEFYRLNNFKTKENQDWDTIVLPERVNKLPLNDQKMSTYLSIEELKKLPNNKLYSFPESGICFEFINKSNNIDRIEIKENTDSFTCDIALINNHDTFIGNMSDVIGNNSINIINKIGLDGVKKKLKRVEEKTIIYKTVIPKEVIFNFKTYENIHTNSLCNVSFWLFENNFTQRLFYQYEFHCIMSCIYIAYYCPNRLANDIILTTIQNKNKSSGTRESSYRQEYMRKLPKGYSHSKDAEELARKKGYLNIPNGYTFVSESNIAKKNESKQKIIKIE